MIFGCIHALQYALLSWVHVVFFWVYSLVASSSMAEIMCHSSVQRAVTRAWCKSEKEVKKNVSAGARTRITKPLRWLTDCPTYPLSLATWSCGDSSARKYATSGAKCTQLFSCPTAVVRRGTFLEGSGKLLCGANLYKTENQLALGQVHIRSSQHAEVGKII